MKKLNRSKLVNWLPVVLTAIFVALGLLSGVREQSASAFVDLLLLYLISFLIVEFLAFFRGEDLIVFGYKNVDASQKITHRAGALAVDLLFIVLFGFALIMLH